MRVAIVNFRTREDDLSTLLDEAARAAGSREECGSRKGAEPAAPEP